MRVFKAVDTPTDTRDVRSASLGSRSDVQALEEARRYGLYDLERVERMVLKRIGEDFFFLNGDAEGDGDE